MTIDEAIEHAREVARNCNDYQCAVDHVQIAEWLSLLKVYTDTNMADEVRRARHEMHGWQLEWKREMERRKELEAENDKLRELVRQWYPHMLKRVGRDALEQWGQMDVVKELRIEVRE